jgi:hypothetical protein
MTKHITEIRGNLLRRQEKIDICQHGKLYRYWQEGAVPAKLTPGVG